MSFDSLEPIRIVDEFDSRLFREQFQGSDQIVRRDVERLRGCVSRRGYCRRRQQSATNEYRKDASFRRNRENRRFPISCGARFPARSALGQNNAIAALLDVNRKAAL